MFSNYSEVSSYSIRCRYKNDFNAAYPQYCDLKNRMEKVMEEFQRLEEQWKQAEGTPEEDVRNLPSFSWRLTLIYVLL